MRPRFRLVAMLVLLVGPALSNAGGLLAGAYAVAHQQLTGGIFSDLVNPGSPRRRRGAPARTLLEDHRRADSRSSALTLSAGVAGDCRPIPSCSGEQIVDDAPADVDADRRAKDAHDEGRHEADVLPEPPAEPAADCRAEECEQVAQVFESTRRSGRDRPMPCVRAHP